MIFDLYEVPFRAKVVFFTAPNFYLNCHSTNCVLDKHFWQKNHFTVCNISIKMQSKSVWELSYKMLKNKGYYPFLYHKMFFHLSIPIKPLHIYTIECKYIAVYDLEGLLPSFWKIKLHNFEFTAGILTEVLGLLCFTIGWSYFYIVFMPNEFSRVFSSYFLKFHMAIKIWRNHPVY